MSEMSEGMFCAPYSKPSTVNIHPGIRSDTGATDSQPAATKHDTGKTKWNMLPPGPLADIIAVLEFGAAKYGENDWRNGCEWSRPFNACMRHLWAWWRGEENDPESNLPHLAHAACNLLFLLEWRKTKAGKDDRYVAPPNQ